MTDDVRLTALVRYGRQLDGEIKDLGEKKKGVVKLIDEAVEVGWRLLVDGTPATKTTGNRAFNPKLAIERFTDEEKVACVSTQVDLKAVRRLADEKGITEQCMVDPEDGKTSVRFG